MSFSKLTKLIRPPKHPVETGSADSWVEVENKLSTHLPSDYKEFITKYGTGRFGHFFHVYNPFAANSKSNLLARTQQLCEQYRNDHEENPERFPYGVFPNSGGILPWGHDENGNFYFWVTKGEPDGWTVTADESRGDGFSDYNRNLTDYLVGVLEGKIPSLAGDYPKKEYMEFESDVANSNKENLAQQLLDAIDAKNETRLKEILGKGIDINSIKDHSGVNALSRAVSEGLSIVELLVENGADVNQVNDDGTTALQSAATSGKLDVTEFLLKAGANPNAGDPSVVSHK